MFLILLISSSSFLNCSKRSLGASSVTFIVNFWSSFSLIESSTSSLNFFSIFSKFSSGSMIPSCLTGGSGFSLFLGFGLNKLS